MAPRGGIVHFPDGIWIPDAESLTDWPQALLPLFFASFAARSHRLTLAFGAGTSVDPRGGAALGRWARALRFPLLVLERIYANIDPELLPEGPQLNRLLRVR